MSIEIEDAKGRKLSLKEPGDPLLLLDVLEAAGRDARGNATAGLATNQAWVGMANLACHVEDIDGVPEPMPTNVPQIRALIGKLGREGMAAVSSALGNDDTAGKADASLGKS